MQMKSWAVLALLTAGTATAHAQSIAAGTISLGGGIGYSRTSDKESSSFGGTNYSNELTYSQFSVRPVGSYFVADNLAVGLSLGYSSAAVSTDQSPSRIGRREDLDPTTNFQVGPFVQYYKMFSEQFGVTGNLGAGYQSGTRFQYIGNTNDAYELNSSGYYAELTPGIVFFPIPKFAINASIGSLGYSRVNNDFPKGPFLQEPDNFEDTSSTFGASFGLSQLQFGGTFFFGR